MSEVLYFAAEFEASGKGAGLACGLLGLVVGLAIVLHDRNRKGE